MSLAEELGKVMGEEPGAALAQMHHPGLTMAKVTKIEDEKNLNRVKCLPIGSADAEETDWCYVMSPMGGAERGLFLFPQVGDLVILGYLNDDPHRPVVLGCYWNTEVAPPVKVEKGKAEDYVFSSPGGCVIALHDEKDKQEFYLTMATGSSLAFSDPDEKILLLDKNGENTLTIDMKGGEIELKAKTKLTLSAGNSKITLEQGGEITIESQKGITLNSTDIKISAKSKVALDGTNIDAKAKMSLALQGAMEASLKGGMVKIN